MAAGEPPETEGETPPLREHHWDEILRNMSQGARRADPQGIGRPWVPGPPLPPTLAKNAYAAIPEMDNGIFLPGSRFSRSPPFPGPPTMRRCVECTTYRPTARPFAGEICLECVRRRLVAGKWRGLIAKMWGRHATKYWEYGVARKSLVKSMRCDSQDE